MSPRAKYSTTNVDPDLQALVRGALSGVEKITGRDYSMNQFTDDAFRSHLETIYRDYNNGIPFPPDYNPRPTNKRRPSKPTTGRGGEE